MYLFKKFVALFKKFDGILRYSFLIQLYQKPNNSLYVDLQKKRERN